MTLPWYLSYGDVENVITLRKGWIADAQRSAKVAYERDQPLRDRLAVTDASQAKRGLILRLGELAQNHGFRYNGVSVRNQRTRWGSCSSKHNISLNIKLILLPEELRDYVMLHELVHTRVHNHSQKFYEELDKVTGNRRLFSSKLKQFRLNEL